MMTFPFYFISILFYLARLLELYFNLISILEITGFAVAHSTPQPRPSTTTTRYFSNTCNDVPFYFLLFIFFIFRLNADRDQSPALSGPPRERFRERETTSSFTHVPGISRTGGKTRRPRNFRGLCYKTINATSINSHPPGHPPHITLTRDALFAFVLLSVVTRWT